MPITLFNIIYNLDRYGNSGLDYLKALLLFVVIFSALRILRNYGLARLQSLAEKTKMKFDDILITSIKRIKLLSYFIISLYLSLQLLSLARALNLIVKVLFLVIVIYESIRIIEKIVGYFIFLSLQKNSKVSQDNEQIRATVRTFNLFVGIILWTFGVLLILSNLNVNVTSLLAGLGIGGIAVALALQSILADVFSSFSILVDKPFQVGDFIIIGDDKGIVQKIGIKTTRIKSLDGQMLIISNQELTTARVQNFDKVKERRSLLKLRISFDTAREKLDLIPKLTEEIISRHNYAKFNYCRLLDLSNYSLDYELSFYITEPNYEQFLIYSEKIKLDVLDRIKQEEIKLAYPTTKVEYQAK